MRPTNLLQRYEALLGRLLAALREHYGEGLVACAVFGSVGRGTQRHDSDLDLLLVIRGLPRGRFRRVEGFLPVETRLEPAPDPKQVRAWRIFGWVALGLGILLIVLIIYAAVWGYR